MAGCRLDAALEHGNVHQGRRHDAFRIVEKHSGVEAPGKPFRRLDRHFAGPEDRDGTFRFHDNRWRAWDIQRGLGQQGGDLRRGLPAFDGPSGPLADVGIDDPCFRGAIRRRFVEQRRFLGTGNQHRPTVESRALECADLSTAEPARDPRVAAPERLGKSGAVKRHGPLAVANQQPLAVNLHTHAPIPVLAADRRSVANRSARSRLLSRCSTGRGRAIRSGSAPPSSWRAAPTSCSVKPASTCPAG